MKSICSRWSIVTQTLFSLATLFALLCSATFAQNGVEDETCLECHDGMNISLASTPHQLSSEMDKPSTLITCVGCHDGGEAHIEDPSPENITNPASQNSFDKRTGCFQCHIAHVGLDNYGWDVHADQAIDCSNCHRIHSSGDNLLLDDNAKFCYNCHDNIGNDMIGRSSHPIAEGVVTCLDCHQFVQRGDQNIVMDLQQTCRKCHPQHAGPYAFEHAPVSGYSVEGDGCMECHKAHGSENDFLLNQPEDRLCKQCHYPEEHRINEHSDNDCMACHTDIHGSFASNLFLDANLSYLFDTEQCISCHSTTKL